MVAIHEVGGDLDTLTNTLAEALEVTAYEARSRVAVSGGGPAIVSTHPDRAQAEPVAQRLRAAGLSALVYDKALARNVSQFAAREFDLTGPELVATHRSGERAEVPWDRIDMLVRGISSSEATTRETVKQRQLSVGRALATGGLMIHKTKSAERVTKSIQSENFLVVCSTVREPVMLRESGLAYPSLGAAMQSSRAANFAHVVAEIRRQATAAIFDERLMRRSLQQQILGVRLSADDDLDLAIALVILTHRMAT